MDRRYLHSGSLWTLVAVILAIVPTAGCPALLTTVLYIAGYNDDPAEFDGLQKKTVVVVCRPPASMQFQDPRVARDLAAEVGKLLTENGSKIKVIDARKVEVWCDANPWDEFAEVGKALKADVVLGIDLERFEIFQGQTLYQGKANATIVVQDCKNEGKTLFEKPMPEAIYPPNTCIPASEMQAAQFRRKFVSVLAEQIGRYFYSHDAHADIGSDAGTM